LVLSNLTNSICVLKSVLKLLEMIRMDDTEAIFVVQADHGSNFSGANSKVFY